MVYNILTTTDTTLPTCIDKLGTIIVKSWCHLVVKLKNVFLKMNIDGADLW